MRSSRYIVLLSGVALVGACGSRPVFPREDGGASPDLPGAADAPTPLDTSTSLDAPPARDDGPLRDAPGEPDAPWAPDRPSLADADADAAATLDLPEASPDAPPGDGLTCATPILLPPGVATTLTADIAAATERQAACGTNPMGPARFYRTVLDPGQTLVVVATALGTPSLVRVTEACEALRCAAEGTIGPMPPSIVTTARYTNPRASPLAVTFSVSYLGSVPTPPPIAVAVRYEGSRGNGLCASAAALTPGVTQRDQDITAASEVPRSCPEGTTRGALWYRASVPPGQVLRATITPAPMSFGQLQAFAFEACGGACATVARSLAADGSPLVARAANHGAAPSDLLLAVNDAVTPRRFDITAALSPAPLNVSCAGAIELTDGAHLRGEDPAVSNARVVPCSSSVARTNALFYTADVAAGHALAVDVATDPIVGSPYMVEVHGACPARSCLAWNRTSDRRALTTWINEGATPRRVTVIVAPNAGDGTPFDLRATIRPPPLNRTCAGAARLSAGVLTGENVAFAREPSVACIGAGGSMYRALYYVARVEPRVRLTVTAQSASVAPMVRLAGGCDGAVCLATSTSSGFGNARATWTNTEGAARDVLVVVSTTSTIVEGTLDLTTALDPP